MLVAYLEGEYLDHAEEGGEGVLGGADLEGHPGLGLADGVAPSLEICHLGVGPKKPEQFKVRSSQCVTNTILMSKYEYEYIWVDFFWRI